MEALPKKGKSVDPIIFPHFSFPEPTTSFTNFLKTAKQNPQAEIVKIGDHTYQVKTDSSHSGDVPLEAHSVQGVDYDQQESQPESEDSPIIPVNLAVDIDVISPKMFLQQLPQSLQSFIKETIQIVKKYNLKSQSFEYQFRFKDLNLQVKVYKKDDTLIIKIQFYGKSEVADLLTEENQIKLLAILKDQFSEDIQLDFERFEDQIPAVREQGEGQDDGQNQPDADENEVDVESDD